MRYKSREAEYMARMADRRLEADMLEKDIRTDVAAEHHRHLMGLAVQFERDHAARAVESGHNREEAR